jgi:hypothetical protein
VREQMILMMMTRTRPISFPFRNKEAQDSQARQPLFHLLQASYGQETGHTLEMYANHTRPARQQGEVSLEDWTETTQQYLPHFLHSQLINLLWYIQTEGGYCYQRDVLASYPPNTLLPPPSLLESLP